MRHAVADQQPRDVQMAVDHGGGAEPARPVGGRLRTAPQREIGVPQGPGGLAHHRPVVDEHGGQLRGQGGESGLGGGHPRLAPRLPRRIRVRVQEVLVGAHDPGLLGQGERLFLGRRPRLPEGVVVEQEERCDDGRAAGALPDRIRVLGGEHAQLPADLHQMLIARHAAQLYRVVLRRPQLVIAGHPDHLGEPAAEQGERPADVGDALTDVAGDQQPVVVGLRS